MRRVAGGISAAMSRVRNHPSGSQPFHGDLGKVVVAEKIGMRSNQQLAKLTERDLVRDIRGIDNPQFDTGWAPR